jgi:hypothetical protein
MENFSIPNSTPAIGRSSTKSLGRSKKRNSAPASFSETFSLTRTVESSTLRRFNAQPAYAEGFGVAGAHLSYRSESEGGTLNPPTPKASAWQALTCLAVAKAKEERSIQTLGHSMFGVGRLPRRSARAKAGSTFSSQSAIRNPQSEIWRVKGAWWPSRSSKPLLAPRMRDQGRFDSYPLRPNKFDVRWVMFEVVRTPHLQSNIKLQTSKIRERR